jgi:flavorubredoxin
MPASREISHTPIQSREIAPGVTWLIGCLSVPKDEERIHSHVSAYLVDGGDRTALIDTGYPAMWQPMEEQLDELLGDREIDYLIPTHPELPHSGCLPLLLEKYPRAEVHCDTRDHAFYFGVPAERLHHAVPGDVLDLGSRRLAFVEAVIRDLPATLWLFEGVTKTLFVADGFSFSHEHEAGQCHLTSAELPFEPAEEQIGFVSERALYWTTYADLEQMFDRLDGVVEQYDPKVIAPAHGSVIVNPSEIIPKVKSGMRGVSRFRG